MLSLLLEFEHPNFKDMAKRVAGGVLTIEPYEDYFVAIYPAGQSHKAG